jgi:hypothetical protein
MGQKFTAIYVDSWMQGSHQISLTKMERLEQLEGETIKEMLSRQGILESTVFIFEGHPKLEGEGA